MPLAVGRPRFTPRTEKDIDMPFVRFRPRRAKLAGGRAWPARISLVAVLVVAALAGLRLLQACPFCSAVSLTLCEEINGADVAVIAKLVAPADPAPAGNPAALGKARFEVVQLLKGEKTEAPGKKLDVIYFGDSPVGSLFLITGVDPANVNWMTPIAINPRIHDYLGKALKLPKEGADRLAFFQDYLEDADELLARDSYDEFAKTPYSGVKELKGRMQHDKLIGWIQNPKVAQSRRRLYLTMLGVCGQKQDAALLETMIRSDDRQVRAGLDALVAAYLTLKGPEGMPLVENLYLKNKDADYTDTYSTIMALRFHGQEEQAIPRARLLEGLRYMLDRPKYADLVIADLARWQDWGAMDRLVKLFKDATDDTIWVRVPVINFLQVCPLPEAKQHLAELAKLDPDSFKKATSLFPVGGAATRDKSAAGTTDGKSDAGAAKPESKKPEKDSSAAAPSDAGPNETGPNGTGPSETSTAVAAVTADDADPNGTSASQLVAAAAPVGSVRLSRAAPPIALAGAPQGAGHVLAWMALAGCVLGMSFWAILFGGRKAA
jgi:hypothetical protein